MPKIYLSDFVDIISKSGTPKATKVRQVKYREEYTPLTDFYKQLREGIINVHENNEDRSSLQKIMLKVTDTKKKSNYPAAIEGYYKWWGRKKLEWFQPQGANYTHEGFEVIVNPDVGLILDNKKIFVKFYFKSDKLVKNRANLILGMMQLALLKDDVSEYSVAILDVRNSKLFEYTEEIKDFSAMVKAELSYVATIWGDI